MNLLDNQNSIQDSYLVHQWIQESDYVFEESDNSIFLCTKKPENSVIQELPDISAILNFLSTNDSTLVIMKSGTYFRYNRATDSSSISRDDYSPAAIDDATIDNAVVS